MICITLYGKTDICSIVFHHLRRSAPCRPGHSPHFPGTGITAPAILAALTLTQVKYWQSFVMAESRQSPEPPRCRDGNCSQLVLYEAVGAWQAVLAHKMRIQRTENDPG
jgi:hypothetical protein